MSDILNLCVVNFYASSLDKDSNIRRIYGFIRAAAKRGADMIVFPELCVNGYECYDLCQKHFLNEPESLEGEFSFNLLKLAKQYNIYIIVGMAEKDKHIYNTALVVSPQKIVGGYRKIHPFGDENLWCAKGDKPFIFESEWGNIGVGICYDTYQFPELMRYYASQDVRLYLNPTALIEEIDKCNSRQAFLDYYAKALEYGVLCNTIFIASANLVGKDRNYYFGGGSCILGPKITPFFETNVYQYGGDFNNTQEGIFLSTLDLSLATTRLCTINKHTKEPDYRPKLYAEWIKEV